MLILFLSFVLASCFHKCLWLFLNATATDFGLLRAPDSIGNISYDQIQNTCLSNISNLIEEKDLLKRFYVNQVVL